MAGTYDLNINQGMTHKWEVTYTDDTDTPVDLTGYQGRGQIRMNVNSPDVLCTLTVTVVTPLSGRVDVLLPASETEGLSLRGRTAQDRTEAQYDVEVFNPSSGKVVRLLQGSAFISPEVTK